MIPKDLRVQISCAQTGVYFQLWTAGFEPGDTPDSEPRTDPAFWQASDISEDESPVPCSSDSLEVLEETGMKSLVGAIGRY